MAKRRPSGDGMVRKREDGRREGRIVVGHKDNGDSILPLYLRRYSEGADRQAPAAHRPLPGSGLDGVEPDDYERIVIGGWTAGWKISPGPYGPTPWPDTVGRWSGTSSPIWETSLSPRSRGKTFKGYTTHWLSAETGTPGEGLSSGTIRGIHSMLHEVLAAAQQAESFHTIPPRRSRPPSSAINLSGY